MHPNVRSDPSGDESEGFVQPQTALVDYAGRADHPSQGSDLRPEDRDLSAMARRREGQPVDDGGHRLEAQSAGMDQRS